MRTVLRNEKNLRRTSFNLSTASNAALPLADDPVPTCAFFTLDCDDDVDCDGAPNKRLNMFLSKATRYLLLFVQNVPFCSVHFLLLKFESTNQY